MSQVTSIMQGRDGVTVTAEHDGASWTGTYPAEQSVEDSCREACLMVESLVADRDAPATVAVEVPKAFRSDVVRLTPTPAVEPATPVKQKG